MNDPASAACVRAERRLLAMFEGGCALALGCLARPQGTELRLEAALWRGEGDMRTCAVTADVCATSWATPHASGAAALVRQYYTEGWGSTGTKVAANGFTPSGALIRATLVNSAVNMSGPANYPNATEGWGLIRIDRALMFNDNGRNLVFRDIRNQFGLRTGEDFTQGYTVSGGTSPS